MLGWMTQLVVRKIQLFRSRTNIPEQRDANYINFTCLTKGPHGAIQIAGIAFGSVGAPL